MRISDWSSDVCSSDLLQTINSAYQTSWAIADKVQTGTIDKAGGVTALHDIRTALGEDWRELESGTPDMAAQFEENRIDADRAVERLAKLLRVGKRDHRDFFSPGQLDGAVEPLLNRNG